MSAATVGTIIMLTDEPAIVVAIAGNSDIDPKTDQNAAKQFQRFVSGCHRWHAVPTNVDIGGVIDLVLGFDIDFCVLARSPPDMASK